VRGSVYDARVHHSLARALSAPCLLLAAALLAASPAPAATVTWTFEGAVRGFVNDYSNPPPDGFVAQMDALGVRSGSLVHGSAQIDLETANIGYGSLDEYPGAIRTWGISLGDMTLALGPSSNALIEVSHRYPGNPSVIDSYVLYALGMTGSVGPAPGEAKLVLSDATNTLFPWNTILAEPPPLDALGAFDLAAIQARVEGPSHLYLSFAGGGAVVVELTSLASVPEPELAVLCVFALALALRSRGRDR
jgi:hypothetical protein